jgi:hypothetical protein
MEGGGILDKPFTGVRMTILAGFLSVLEGWPETEDDQGCADAIRDFYTKHRRSFTIWSEAAIPFWLAVFWHFRRCDATASVDFVLRDLIALISQANRPDGLSPLANPYYELSEILPHVLGLTEDRINESFQGRSYSLEGLVHLFVRRNWKQAFRRLWPDISRIAFAHFEPDTQDAFFAWRCQEGVNRHVFPKHTQAWDELVSAAAENAGTCIPEPAKAYPHFVLLYLLVCPHRATASAVRWLDSALA